MSNEVLGPVDHGLSAPLANDHPGNLPIRGQGLDCRPLGGSDDGKETAPDAALNSASIWLRRAYRFHHTFRLQYAASCFQAELIGNVPQVYRRKVHTAHVRDQASSVGEDR